MNEYAVTATRVIAGVWPGSTVAVQVPAFRVDAASKGEARVKAQAILGREPGEVELHVDIQEL